MIFYYSGCGNSRFVAQTLADSLGERLVFIPDAARAGEYSYELTSDEMVGFVWPVYCWAPPELVRDFVSRLSISGKPSHLWLVATCGDEAGLTEKIFRKDLSKRGLSLDACYTVQMPETYINIAPMKLDTPEGAAVKIAKAKELLPEIIEGIRRREKVSRMALGGASWLKSRIIKPLFYAFLVTDKKWQVKDSCIGCGVCEKVCPLHNITMKNSRPHWNGNCTTCNSCYHHCPVNAIQFGKATEGKGQYFYKFGSSRV